MKEISSMDRLMTVAKSSKAAGQASGTNKKQDEGDSFDQIMADTAASADVPKKTPEDKTVSDKKTGDETTGDAKTEDTSLAKGEKPEAVKQLMVMDISQMIPVTGGDGVEANILRSGAERAATVVVAILPEEKTAEGSLLQTVQPEKTAELQTETKTKALPEMAEKTSEHLQQKNSVVQLQGKNTTVDGAGEQKEAVQNQPKESIASLQQSKQNVTDVPQTESAPVLLQSKVQETETAKQPSEVTIQSKNVEASAPVVILKQENAGETDAGKSQSGQSEIASEKKTETPLTETAKEAFVPGQPVKSEVETVKIKVAEPYRNMDTEATKQLAGKITESVEQGKKEMVIQLTPEHLGKISIKISVAEEGVKIVLGCENQRTLSLLSDKAAGINQIVESNLNQHAVVEIKEDGYWNQQKNATDQHQQQNGRQNEEQNDNRNKEETDDFIQQLRLGMRSEELSV